MKLFFKPLSYMKHREWLSRTVAFFEQSDIRLDTSFSWKRSFFLFFVCFMFSFPFSAVIRIYFGASFASSLAAAILLCASVALLLGSLANPDGRHINNWLYSAPFVVVCALGLFHFLYNPYFSGFPGQGGGDAGQHLMIYRKISANSEYLYQGMVAFYGTVYWIEKLFFTDTFIAFIAASYIAPAGIVISILLIGTHIFKSSEKRLGNLSLGLFWVLGLAVFYYPATRIALPLLHYYQCDGYLSQLYSVGMILIFIVLYSTAHYRLSRLLLLGIGVLLLRYTYLLNLADMFTAAMIMFFVEIFQAGLHKKLLGVFLGAAVLGLSLAAFLYWNIAGLMWQGGGFYRIDTAKLAIWNLAISLILMLAPYWSHLMKIDQPPGAKRYFLFCGLFSGLSCMATLIWRAVLGTDEYYYHKYPFCAVLIGIGGTMILVTHLLGEFLVNVKVQARLIVRRSIILVSMMLFVALCTSKMADACNKYYGSLLERADGKPPWNSLTMIADPGTIANISKVLNEKNRQLKKLITQRWPEASFTNAYFGIKVGPTEEFDAQENTCLFWYEPESFKGQVFEKRRQAFEAFYQSVKKEYSETCVQYPAQEDPTVERSLCHICFSEENRQFDLELKKIPWNQLRNVPSKMDLTGRSIWKGAVSHELSPVLNDSKWKCHVQIEREDMKTVEKVFFNGNQLKRMGDIWPIRSRSIETRQVNYVRILHNNTRQPNLGPIVEEQSQSAEMKHAVVKCLLPDDG